MVVTKKYSYTPKLEWSNVKKKRKMIDIISDVVDIKFSNLFIILFFVWRLIIHRSLMAAETFMCCKSLCRDMFFPSLVCCFFINVGFPEWIHIKIWLQRLVSLAIFVMKYHVRTQHESFVVIKLGSFCGQPYEIRIFQSFVVFGV